MLYIKSVKPKMISFKDLTSNTFISLNKWDGMFTKIFIKTGNKNRMFNFL